MITVIGEAIIDLVGHRDGATFDARPGGSPYNVAIAAARLGVPTQLLARFGPDGFGTLLRAHAASSGVDLSEAASADEPTTLAITSIDAHGGASYDFYINGTADWHWTEAELDAAAASSIVHFGSLASWIPPGDAIIRAALAQRPALITYDPNIRPRLAGDRRRIQAVVEDNISLADVVKASEEDLQWLYPHLATGDVARRWLTGRPSLAFVTSGRDGATAYRPKHQPLQVPARTVAVVDTVGAGDAWMGSILAGLHARGATNAESINGLSATDIADLLETAMLVASLACARPGADPPTADNVVTARRMDHVLPT